ncbi:MAG: hypothetical protein HC917_05515 [Richelia sp. SM2_1_7]|nr:hypothetical protein [Richelia sp. SM2_1_7]
MSKSNVTENDLVKFYANNVSMPLYGTNLYVHLHTSDPGEAGTSSSSEATYTGYARVTTIRDSTAWTICDVNGTPNANGSAFKNAIAVVFPECTGVSDDEIITHASLCTNGGQILYSGALTASIRITNLTTPYFPIGTLIFKED